MKKILFALMIICCYGCSNNNIKIGVVLALTGDLSSYGQAIKQGIDLAYDELSQDNVDIIYMDSQGASTNAVSALYSLINLHRVQFVIGDVSSSTTLSMIPIIDKNNIFLLSPGAATPELTNISPLFARNYPSSTDESVQSANFIYNKITSNNVASIYSNDDYGSGLFKEFKDAYNDQGGKVCFEESYKTGTTQFREIILKLRNTPFDCLYLSGNQREMGAFIKQYKEYGLTQPVVANMAFLEKDCLEVAGQYADNVVIPIVQYQVENDNPFIQKFKHKYNSQPTMVNALGYDALNIIMQGITKSDNTPSGVATYVRNLRNYDGAMGKLHFKDGNVVVPIEFKTIINGNIVDYN